MSEYQTRVIGRRRATSGDPRLVWEVVELVGRSVPSINVHERYTWGTPKFVFVVDVMAGVKDFCRRASGYLPPGVTGRHLNDYGYIEYREGQPPLEVECAEAECEAAMPNFVSPAMLAWARDVWEYDQLAEPRAREDAKRRKYQGEHAAWMRKQSGENGGGVDYE